jgi:tetratricopeptide (TPR) repeat protein
MKLAFLTLTLVTMGAACISPAFGDDPAAVAAARRDLQSAVNHGDAGALLAVRGKLAAQAVADPGSSRLQLWIATAAWRAVPILMSKDAKQAERLGDDALDRLEKVLVADPKNAEALALKGGLQGLLISLKPDAMMTLGPQSGANLARAASLQPGNPRVHLLNGVGVMHTPPNFGGGPEPALKEFLRAQELFAQESVSDSTAPDWGRDDAFLWAGRAQMALKDTVAARASFRAALKANPDNGWVKHGLLPEAEGGGSAKDKP